MDGDSDPRDEDDVWNTPVFLEDDDFVGMAHVTAAFNAVCGGAAAGEPSAEAAADPGRDGAEAGPLPTADLGATRVIYHTMCQLLADKGHEIMEAFWYMKNHPEMAPEEVQAGLRALLGGPDMAATCWTEVHRERELEVRLQRPMMPTGPIVITPAQKAILIRQQQERVLNLRHASKCHRLDDRPCPVEKPDCMAMRALWKHIGECRLQRCEYPYCIASRFALAHWTKCKDEECPVCGPVKEQIRLEKAAATPARDGRLAPQG